MKTIAERWLIEQKYYDKFEANMLVYAPDRDIKGYFENTKPNEIILNAFNWSLAPESISFWSRVSGEYFGYLRSEKIRALRITRGIKFLIDSGYMEMFEKNIAADFGYESSPLAKYCSYFEKKKHEPSRFVSHAFSWSETEEGFNFWKPVSIAFKESMYEPEKAIENEQK